ncbi:MAG: D-lyxose/D-mannose family sugar isomerase [Verrucomicrobiae bacterium]|nr:D-lyxose/D-mannose family sugar isomerase [Verrucomicrobiae bacterium]
MKRSEVNAALARAMRCFAEHEWALPPNPGWDVTDFGLGDFSRYGAVLVNLAQEEEYSEKVIYMTYRQAIPNHCHRRKKEDIICRVGVISVQLFFGQPGKWDAEGVIQINNVKRPHRSGDVVHLRAGERVTIPPPVYHEFWALSDEAIVGEVSTKNDDLHDNFFVNPRVGRFPKVEEDEPPLVWLVSERTAG